MAISLRLNEQDTLLIKKYATLHNISVSELVRQAVIEKIEDEYDLKVYELAVVEFSKYSTTYSLDEVEKELGLN